MLVVNDRIGPGSLTELIGAISEDVVADLLSVRGRRIITRSIF